MVEPFGERGEAIRPPVELYELVDVTEVPVGNDWPVGFGLPCEAADA